MAVPSSLTGLSEKRPSFLIGDEEIRIPKPVVAKNEVQAGSGVDVGDTTKRLESLSLDGKKETALSEYREAFEIEKKRLCDWIGVSQARLVRKSDDRIIWQYEQIKVEVKTRIEVRMGPLQLLEGFDKSPLSHFINANVQKIKEGMDLLSNKYFQPVVDRSADLDTLRTLLEEKVNCLNGPQIDDFIVRLRKDKNDIFLLVPNCRSFIDLLKADIRVLQDQMLHVAGIGKKLNIGQGDILVPFLYTDKYFTLYGDSLDIFRDIEILKTFYEEYNQIMLSHIGYFQGLLSRIIEIQLICEDCQAFLDKSIEGYLRIISPRGRV